MNNAHIYMVFLLIFRDIFYQHAPNVYQYGFVYVFVNIVEKKNLQNIRHIYMVSLLSLLLFFTRYII